MFPTKDAHTGETKYAGRSKAKVLDNVDPLKRGRIIVDHPLLGSTVWIDYLKAPGSFSVPAIDSLVYIECDAGYKTHPIAWGNVTKGDETTDIPEVFSRNEPTNRGFFTPGGHLIELDDGSDNEGTGRGVRITTSSGMVVNIDDLKDSITLDTVNGEHIEASKDNGIQLSTPDNGGTTASFKGGEIALTDGNSNEVALTSSGIKLTESGGGELNLASGKVALGGPTAELLDLVDQIIDQLDQTETAIQAITVPTAVGPSGPPINSASFIAIQKTLSTIKSLLGGIKGSL